jgi:hypothetical protein
MVSPVVAENSTSVTFYVPNATYYDFFDLTPVQGTGSEITVDEVGYETIPLHILGGSVIPLRTGAANTTDQNRQLPFHIVVAPDASGVASGELRLDDGISLDVGDNFSDVTMDFATDTLTIGGTRRDGCLCRSDREQDHQLRRSASRKPVLRFREADHQRLELGSCSRRALCHSRIGIVNMPVDLLHKNQLVETERDIHNNSFL